MVVVRPVLSINSQPSQELVVMFFCLGTSGAGNQWLWYVQCSASTPSPPKNWL